MEQCAVRDCPGNDTCPGCALTMAAPAHRVSAKGCKRSVVAFGLRRLPDDVAAYFGVTIKVPVMHTWTFIRVASKGVCVLGSERRSWGNVRALTRVRTAE